MLISLREGVPLTGAMPFPPLFEGLGDLPESGTFSYHVFPNLSIVFVGHGFVFFITNWPKPDGSSAYHVHWFPSLHSEADAGRKANDRFTRINQDVLFGDLQVLHGMPRPYTPGPNTPINHN